MDGLKLAESVNEDTVIARPNFDPRQCTNTRDLRHVDQNGKYSQVTVFYCQISITLIRSNRVFVSTLTAANTDIMEVGIFVPRQSNVDIPERIGPGA